MAAQAPDPTQDIRRTLAELTARMAKTSVRLRRARSRRERIAEASALLTLRRQILDLHQALALSTTNGTP
jgi:hypothetical protein